MSELAELRSSAARLRETVERLGDGLLSGPSLLPGWSRSHVLTHIARSADSRRRLLAAARQGVVGRQYASEEQRAREIDDGAARPPGVVREDARQSLELLLAAVDEHPADRWDAPGEWLGVGISPVRRVVPSMRRELEYHHVDLDAGYGPRHWPADFVDAQLASVTESFGKRGAAFEVHLPDRILPVGDGGRVRVSGDPAEVLAWLTGRADGATLHVDPPGPLPERPPLA